MKIQTTIAGAMALIAAACVNAAPAQVAQAPKLDAKTQGYVDRMLANSYQIRVGRYEVANDAVAMMEKATAEEPGNAELWAHLGNAYGLQATLFSQPGYKPMDAFTTLGKGFAAQEKALALDPDNIVALGGHGSNAMIFSLIRRKPELAQQGIAEMNRANALAPKDNAHVQRLLRVLTTINFPDNLRDKTQERSDIAYVFPRAEGTRQGDYVRVISGDISIEAGQPDLARAAYALAAKSRSPGGDIARQRLASLDAGGVPATDIAKLRKDVGACTTCHGG